MTLSTTANDDSGSAPQSNTPGTPPISPANSSTTNPTPSSAVSSAAASATPVTGDWPGRRLFNPLGQLSSYTYQISLYVITPDAYEAFLNSGKQQLNVIPQSQAGGVSVNTASSTNQNISSTTGQPITGGAYLVAQSGGMGSPQSRAPGFNFDYGIDNLTFDHQVSTNENGAAALDSSFTFTITEPYGFSLIDNLKKAQYAINTYSNTTGVSPDPSNQIFILGVRFYGYLPCGTVATGKEVFNGIPLDPTASGSGALFETFYDIAIKKFSFKLGPGITTYSIEAAYLATSEGFGVKKGYLNGSSNITCNGSTVGQVLNDLVTQLNAKQQQLTQSSSGKNPAQKYPIKYSITYQGNAVLTIQNASMLVPTDKDKSKSGMSSATTSTQSNPKTEVNSVYNPSTKTITFAPQPILQCIDQTITSSNFLLDALASNPISTTDGTNATIKNPNPGYPVWYNCSTRLENPRWDNIINDWVFDIIYVIQEYQTPLVNSPAITKTQPYYGPFKRYQYWYTGQNTEIIDYDHTLDKSYFNAGLGTADADDSEGTPSTTPIAPAQGTAQSTTNSLGNGGQAIASYKGSLYDPGSYVHAKVTILGDPDYLMQDTAQPDDLYTPFYSPNGYNIAPNSGQVFIEINFNEPIDYDTSSTGLMNVNNAVLFQPYNDSVLALKDSNGLALVQGVSYQINTVHSSFSGGKFTQTFDMQVNMFNGAAPNSDAGGDASPSTANTGPVASNSTAQNSTTGLTPVPKPAPHVTVAEMRAFAMGAPPEPTT